MDKKICTQCREEKDLCDFAPHKGRKDGTQSRCKVCYAVYQRDYYRKRVIIDDEYRIRKQTWRKQRSLKKRETQQKRIWEYLLSHPCVDCGESDPIVLEFDHVRGEKKYNISGLIHTEVNWILVEEEIAKCDVRCANCHRRKTAKQFGWYSWRNNNRDVA